MKGQIERRGGSCTAREELQLPIKGTASLVLGIISDTIFINTVSESNIVTPKYIILQFLKLINFTQLLPELQIKKN